MVASPAPFLKPEVYSRTRARLLVELRDQFHIALIALLSPLRRLREDVLAVRLGQLHQREARLVELRRILRSRLARMHPGTRPHYSPSARAEILIDKHHLRLSDRATASIYVLARQTVGSWNIEVDRGERRRLVLPRPALDDHQEAIQRAGNVLPAAAEDHKAQIAALLAQLTSLAAARHGPRGPGSGRAAERKRKPPGDRSRRGPIRSRRPNHYWSVDLTELRSLFGIHRPYLAVILDLYSRYPVAWRLWPRRPGSAEMAELLGQALAEWGPPRHLLVSHLVSDQGGEFIGEPFERVLATHRIGHRFGAVGEHGSIAIIERLWLTIKSALDENDLPRLRFDDIQRRVAAAIDWYARLRPHSTLRGATPRERYLGLRPACLDPAKPCRGRRGEPCLPREDIELRFALPEEKRLPYLVRRAA